MHVISPQHCTLHRLWHLPSVTSGICTANALEWATATPFECIREGWLVSETGGFLAQGGPRSQQGPVELVLKIAGHRAGLGLPPRRKAQTPGLPGQQQRQLCCADNVQCENQCLVLVGSRVCFYTTTVKATGLESGAYINALVKISNIK